MNSKYIDSEILVSYFHCPRKSYFLMLSPDQGQHDEYQMILAKHRQQSSIKYLEEFRENHPDAQFYTENLFKKNDLLLKAKLKIENLMAECALLERKKSYRKDNFIAYEPTIVTGTYSITKEQKIELFFVGMLLGKLQDYLPIYGYILSVDEKVYRIKLDKGYKQIKPFLKVLTEWLDSPPNKPPELCLNKHCPICQFRQICYDNAKKENHLSLLNRMTPKIIRKYHKRGIFTVQQLSYLFRPRRRLKKRGKQKTVKHNLELQALAIREQKIYIQEIPNIDRQPIEIFLDFEGIPDQNFYYLLGLQVCERENCNYYSFWADSIQDEEMIWNNLVSILEKYPDIPIYHYGNYEVKAINTLKNKYKTKNLDIESRLVNICSYIFGKIYFPVFSNSLKQISNFLNFYWSSSEASGQKSLLWRYTYEETKNTECKSQLITYNMEDCQALELLVNTISDLEKSSISSLKIGFADEPQKYATIKGDLIHKQFETIVKTAHRNYDKNKISLRQIESSQDKNESKHIRKRTTHRKIIPKAQKVIQISRDEICPVCHSPCLKKTNKISERNIIDLVFMKNGVKKIVVKYWGYQGYCSRCSRSLSPSGIRRFGANQIYGHGFQVWMVYQRLELRLPYRAIVRAIEEQFNESINNDTATRCITYVARYYKKTEEILTEYLLNSSFIHVDETGISIEGKDWYVWVITNGKHVIFKLTETRETSIIHQILSGYEGILVSDFYPGYDSLECRQQKCWVHLIRDMNHDLWREPFDLELETFVSAVRDLIVPIYKTIEKYGLRKRNLKKFKKCVERFYSDKIDRDIYESELVNKYQKRFIRYRHNLFQYLEEDNIPWHNNTAENAIRHFAIQRTISGHFYESVTHDYLLLLGIRQTCRFQNKPLLKFLLSGMQDIDKYRSSKRRKQTRPVGTKC